MNHNDLKKPLLDDIAEVEEVDNIEVSNQSKHHQSDEDNDVDDTRAVWFLCSLKVMGSDDADDDFVDDEDDVDDLEMNLIIDDEDDEDDKNSDSSSSRRWYWNCFISSVLPLLLYFQFYITYHYHDTNTDTADMGSLSSMIMMTNDWASIRWSIFLFIVTSILYRQSMTFQQQRTPSVEKNSISYFELLLHLLPDIIIDVLLILVLFHYYVVAVLVMQLSTIFLAVNAILNSCNCSIYVGTTAQERY